ncbi:hypothetical protein EsH8_VI_000847 [Colletotrichum jinshuiense]
MRELGQAANGASASQACAAWAAGPPSYRCIQHVAAGTMGLSGIEAVVRRVSINNSPEPVEGKVVSIIVAMISACLLATLFFMRFSSVKDWRILPWTMWLVALIYFFSFLFVFGTSILQFGFGTDLNFDTCSAATLFCLGAYVLTKFIYLFMVDRAHIIRQTRKSRLKSKLYLVNSFGMLGVFVLIVIMNFIFRITHFKDGICIIGMEQPVLLPLISFDAAINVYLTILFLLPLLRSCCTLLSSVTNLTVLMALNGEIAWLCLLCCNTDIFFSALVINWITSPGQESTLRTLTRPSRGLSTLNRDEVASIPLDPDGNSTRKTWEHRRTRTPTIGHRSAEGPDEDLEQGPFQVSDEQDEMDETDEREPRNSGSADGVNYGNK